MRNAIIEGYPDSIIVNGESYLIDTDFRRWIGLTEALLDSQLGKEDLNYLIQSLFIDRIPNDGIGASRALMNFLNRTNEERKPTKKGTKGKRVLSFSVDCDYIIGAFMECYRMDLVHIRYMHWWHFLALLKSLNSTCELKQRMEHRSINLSKVKNKKERARIRKIQRDIALPSLEMDEDDIADAFG